MMLGWFLVEFEMLLVFFGIVVNRFVVGNNVNERRVFIYE